MRHFYFSVNDESASSGWSERRHQAKRQSIFILYLALSLSGVETEKGKASKPKKQRGQVVLFLRDAGVALILVVLVLVSMFAYTGLWPPIVVIESNSMMHGTDNLSHIGAIDTGDLVLVRKVTKPSDISTFMDGLSSGHRTYGDYGDVVIYWKGGSHLGTPIIHRALIYLQANPDGTSYSSASLRNAPTSEWAVTNHSDVWNHLTSALIIKNISYNRISVSIDIAGLIQGAARLGEAPSSGFITKGDHNPLTDQVYWGPTPIDISWIVGKARGEIPWFGLLKLWSTHTLGSPAPSNSVRDMWIALGLIVISPLAVDFALSIREKRITAAKRAKAQKKSEAPQEEAAPPGEQPKVP